MDASAPHSEGVVLCNPFKWDIVLFISGQKACCLYAFPNSKLDFILQPQEQKSGGRQLQCSSIL